MLNNDNIYNLILDGLTQLQNRGYDSAGLCLLKNGQFEVYKYASTNELDALDKLKNINLISSPDCFIGFGHNRWATHGVKNDINSHPHLSNSGNISLVHNGIIENYNELKNILLDNKYTFKSQTDTEIIVNMIDFNYNKCLSMFEAIKQTIQMLKGTYGVIIQSVYEPDILYCVRNGSPILIGQNEDRVIISSEQSGFCGMINNYITLHNHDICVIKRENNKIIINTKQLYKNTNTNSIISPLTPYPYKHWTLKEIYEQPEVVINSINKGGRIKNEKEVKLGGLEKYKELFEKIDNVILLGCGTSYFAGQYGTHFFKQLCNFNTIQLFDGAEFNSFDIPKYGNTVFILISQSGETKDLHRCLDIAKNNNILTIGVINVVDSLIARDVDCGIYCNAGKEVGVASTKAFLSQVICLSLISVWFSELHKINEIKRKIIINDLNNLSNDIKNTLETYDEKINNIASKNICMKNMFILGKGTDECIAKEGALKIKEIAYIHSEGYSSSSLKHGPFALLDENFPVVLLDLDKDYNSKNINCYKEIQSRNSPILYVTNNTNLCDLIDSEIIVLRENKSYSSLLGIIVLQLYAYYLSINKGLNPDRPKNLAKVVTVE